MIPFGVPFLWLVREGSGWPHAPQCPISLGLGLQYPLAFALSFSRWLCTHPELYRLPVVLKAVGPMVPGDLLAKGSLVSGCASLEWAGLAGPWLTVFWISCRAEEGTQEAGRQGSRARIMCRVEAP